MLGVLFGISALLLIVAPFPTLPERTASALISFPSNQQCAKVRSLEDVYREPLTDLPSRRFVRLLETANATRRRTVLIAARAPIDSKTMQTVEAARRSSACFLVTARISYERMADAVSAVWNIADEKDADRMATLLRTVAIELAIRDVVDTSRLDAMLTPFGTSLAALSAPMVTTVKPCLEKTVDARALRPTQPSLSSAAWEARVTGDVGVKVELDAEGNVLRVSRYTDPAHDTDDHDLRTSAIVAAGTSTYVPERRNCHEVGGKYLFVSSFKE